MTALRSMGILIATATLACGVGGSGAHGGAGAAGGTGGTTTGGGAGAGGSAGTAGGPGGSAGGAGGGATGGGNAGGGNAGTGSSGGAGSVGSGGTGGTAGSGGAGGRDGGGGMSGSGADAGVRDAAVVDVQPGSGNFRVESFDVVAGCKDLDIAVGPTLVAIATNPGQINFYNKDGTFAFKVLPFANPNVGDSHILWDNSSRRWFFSVLAGPEGNDSYIYASRDETGRTWTPNARLSVTVFMDNPQLVVTTDKVSVLNFDYIYTMDKDIILAGMTPNPPNVRSGPVQHTDQTYGIDYGVDVPSTAYFTVMSDNSHFNWITVDGTPKANNVTLVQHKVAVSKPFTQIPPFPGVPGYNNATTPNSGDLGMWDRGRIVWSQTGRCGSGVCPRVFLVDTTTGVMNDFDFEMPGSTLWSCATGFDKDGNVFGVMAQANATTPLSIAVGSMTNTGKLIAPQNAVKGVGAFPTSNFGDFFAASQDPADGSVWGVAHYAKNGACGAKAVHVIPQ